MKKPPYKIGQTYFLINFINGKYISVDKAKYLGFCCGYASYPNLLFGKSIKDISHCYPYSGRAFNGNVSGTAVAATKEEAVRYVEAHELAMIENFNIEIKRLKEHKKAAYEAFLKAYSLIK